MRRLRGTLQDNAEKGGTRSTGKERVTGNLYLNSPLGIGDQLNANLMHSQGTDYARLAFTLPVGYDGWRVGASASLVRSGLSSIL